MSWNKRTKETAERKSGWKRKTKRRTAERYFKSKMEKITGCKEEVDFLKNAAENNIVSSEDCKVNDKKEGATWL